MSDWNDSLIEGAQAEAGPEVGDAGHEAEPTTTEQERQYLELDGDLAERYVKVKVDGEEIDVPLREALSGYSRTADYTRKTQELAQQRQEAQFALTLHRALEASPRETLAVLAQRYGVDFANQYAAQNGYTPNGQPMQQAYEDDDDEFADPLERRYTELERKYQSMEERFAQREADELLRTSVDGLKSRYQLDDGTVRDVVGRALQMGVGPEAFDVIYRSMAYERMVAQQQVQQQAQQQRQQQDSQRQAAAQRAAAVVSQGGIAPQTQPTPPGTAEGPLSIRDAFELAWQQTVEGRG